MRVGRRRYLTCSVLPVSLLLSRLCLAEAPEPVPDQLPAATFAGPSLFDEMKAQGINTIVWYLPNVKDEEAHQKIVEDARKIRAAGFKLAPGRWLRDLKALLDLGGGDQVCRM